MRAEAEEEIGGETFDERLLRDVLAHLYGHSAEAARRLESILEDPLDGGEVLPGFRVTLSELMQALPPMEEPTEAPGKKSRRSGKKRKK